MTELNLSVFVPNKMFRGFAPSNRNDRGVCQHFRTINNTSKMLKICLQHVVRTKTFKILAERKTNCQGCALSKWDDLEKYPFKNCIFFQIVFKKSQTFSYGRRQEQVLRPLSKIKKNLPKIFIELEDTPLAS